MGSTGGNPRKKGEYSLLSEINSEEEWSKLSSREGLFIIDVYSEWSGPCLAMTNFLKKIKLEINDDLLHYASAKIDAIPSLSKFKGLCRPLWLFLSFGQIVAVVHGANAPLLGRVIETEVENEKMVLAGEKVRETISLDDVISDFAEVEDTCLFNNEVVKEADPSMQQEEEEDNQVLTPPKSIIDDFSLLVLPLLEETIFNHLTEFLQSKEFIVAKNLKVLDEDNMIKELISPSEDSKIIESQEINLLLLTKESQTNLEKSPQLELEDLMKDPKNPLSSPEFGVHLSSPNHFIQLLETFFLNDQTVSDSNILLLLLSADAEENRALQNNEDALSSFKVLQTSLSCSLNESLQKIISNIPDVNMDKISPEMCFYLLKGSDYPESIVEAGIVIQGESLNQNVLDELFQAGTITLEEVMNDSMDEEKEQNNEQGEETSSDPIAFLKSLIGS